MSGRLRTAALVLAFAVALAPAWTPSAQEAPADLVLRGGKVATVDDSFTIDQAVAVRGHEVVATGTDAEIGAWIGPETEVVELDGRLAIPGFIEGHGHFLGLGRAKMILDLNGVASWQGIIEMVEEKARELEPGEWIFGRGWHQEKWEYTPAPSVDGVPLHDGLSEVTPDNPVLLTHASGHASFVNEVAMQLAGITDETPDPEGGTIVRDANGRATGMLRETASGLIRVARGEGEEMTDAERDAEFRLQVQLAGQEALENGVTSFQDAGTGFGGIDRLRAMADAGELPVRLYVMVRGQTHEAMDARLPDYRIIPEGNDFLAVRGIKHSIDGALGPHGAWLLEPYADMPDSAGLETTEVGVIERTAEIAAKHGFQLNTHAIGDRANREVLDLYERTFNASGHNGGDLRWRVEHAQHLHPDDIPRFAGLGVIASMQGIHCTSDAPWVFRRLGAERAESGAYMWSDLIDSGAVVTNGTDVPVENISPIASYYASVSRRMADGEIFFPEQRMTREEALRSYTTWAAYAAFEEHLKGRLEPGMLADITVLSADILSIPEEEIPATEIDFTIVGGEVRYRR
ncbi:MAG: amidohydrolase family protein [Acidobacteria bacterium]|nr:amidohydrolase family protein [Acidobacteriota bacterium]